MLTIARDWERFLQKNHPGQAAVFRQSLFVAENESYKHRSKISKQSIAIGAAGTMVGAIMLYNEWWKRSQSQRMVTITQDVEHNKMKDNQLMKQLQSKTLELRELNIDMKSSNCRDIRNFIDVNKSLLSQHIIKRNAIRGWTAVTAASLLLTEITTERMAAAAVMGLAPVNAADLAMYPRHNQLYDGIFRLVLTDDNIPASLPVSIHQSVIKAREGQYFSDGNIINDRVYKAEALSLVYNSNVTIFNILDQN